MDNMNPMPEKKDPTFKCPGCGETLKIEAVGDDMGDKPAKKHAGNMPMGQLKDKISPPNLNSY